MDWLSTKPARQVLLTLLICAALLSVFRGAQNGYHASQDFQWTGARMILNHVDPWRDALNGDPLNRIALTQYPNYLPLLYVFFAPLALLERVPAQLVWVVCNILVAIASAWIAARFFGMSRFGIAATICVLLTCTPTRMTIGNGQQGLFVLLFWSLGLLTLRLTDTRSAVTGISYFKYNFAPPVVIYLWLRSGLRAVLFSFIPAAIGTLLVWLWFTGGRNLPMLSWFIVAPFKLSDRGYTPYGGGANLMDVLEVPMIAAHLSRTVINLTTFCIALIVCIAVLHRVVRKHPASIHCQLALLATLSFGLFKHHTYDSVVLLFTFCYLVRLRHHRGAQIALALLAYIWYVERFVDQFLPRIGDWTFIAQFAMLMIIVRLIFKLRAVENSIFPPAPATPM